MKEHIYTRQINLSYLVNSYLSKTYMDRTKVYEGMFKFWLKLYKEREFPYYLDLLLWHITIYINNTKQLNCSKVNMMVDGS